MSFAGRTLQPARCAVTGARGLVQGQPCSRLHRSCRSAAAAQHSSTADHTPFGPALDDRGSYGPAGSGGGGKGGGSRRLVGESGNGDSSSNHNRQPQWKLLQLLLPALLPAALLQLLHTPGAVAASNSRSRVASKQDDKLLPDWEIDAFVESMWDLSGPILTNMGFSGVLGAAAAAAFKWVGRTLAASVGLALVLIQVLSYWNVITVNWSVVHQQAQQVLDRTGDGRLDKDGFKRALKKGMIILSEGVPSVSGFMVGFVIGLKVF